MKMKFSIVFIVILQVSLFKLSLSQKKICSHTVMTIRETARSTTAYRSTAYGHSCGFLGWKRCRSYKKATYDMYYTTLKYITEQREICCKGYVDYPKCKPTCSQGCHFGGTCIAIDTCKCSSGWKGNDCRTPICSRGCRNGGSCVSPEICRCTTGWVGSTCSIAICEQGCHNGGTCVIPGTCSCSSGWTGYDCKKPICPQGCYNGGTCTRPNICNCNPGWTGHNCKTPICSQGCHNGGTCIDVDTCKCSSGWEGNDCKTPTCSQGCRNGGSCVLPDICRCTSGWTGSSCLTPICSTGCYNGGTCIGPEVCNCKPEWTGINCRTPVCLQRCHHGGTCVGPGICSCKAGWKGSNCTTPDCPQDCYNGGVCTSPFTCTCTTGYAGPDCKIAQCQQVCSNGGICIRPNVCGCKTGWTGYNCTTPHCSQGCYNGECLSSDRCKCFIGWTGPDCTKDINECDDLRTCGYNQKCINTAGSYKCECVTGFKPDTRTLIGISTFYHCTDINECEGDQNFCSQICNNQIGSFNCACKDGYILQADGKQCLDINECLDHNGGCNHMCINTPGSYYCSCNSGYELQADKHNCTDIMECENGLHNCSQVCIELQGEFACTCYNGYELLEDGVSCKEINLCEGEISRCQQLCISTNGSFYCDCLTGYQLSPDNMTCEDINECDQRNGSCSQLCNNTVGSYSCSCKEGYTLDFDGVNCTALPCPHLMDPRNGQYICGGPQITGAICRLKCNRGYKVVGAKKRECLSISKWSENNSFCEILHCDELKNPENGSVILPCAAELGSMCRIVCSPDFYTNSTDLTQKCELVNENTTEWSAPPSCIEKQLCYPNPCKHNGSCIETEEDAFVCDCDDVGYTGKTCEVLLINVPQFSTLAINSEIEFTMSSSPDGEFMLQLIPDDKTSLKVVPSSIIFSQTNTHHNVTMKAIKPGKFTLKYRISDKTLNYLPIPPATILVTNGTVSKSDYFDKYGLKPGLLKPGCCSSETLLNIRCPHNMNFFLKSSCGWIKKESFYLSPGIIFSSANDFDMPIAIAGAKIRKQKSNIYLQNLNKDEFENNCTTCTNESGMQPQCNIRPISLNDIQSFICYESLASTFFHHSSKLTPRWLKLNAMSSNRTHDAHSYMVNLVSSDHLKDISECNKLTPITNGFYSVMLYSGLLKVKVNNELMQSESSSAFCFAINLCEGESSPLYIAIPEDAQTILQSLEFMRDLKSKGWSVTVNSLVISDSRIREIMPSVMLTPIMYWNGEEYFSYNQFPYVLTSVKLNKRFSVDDTVKANWVFTGNVFWIHENIRKAYDPNVNLTWDLYFNGFTRVSVNVPVYGEVSSLQLKNDLEPALFLTKGLNNNVSCHGCSNSSGITFKLLYHIADESTGLFSTLLTIPQKGIDPQYSCPLDSFVFLNSKHDLEAISILSSCLGINLGLLPIYDLQTHIYIFNECKIGSLCSILNDNDANIIVWSTFHDSLLTLKLGHFLELLPVSKSNRTGLVVTFSRNYNHFKANLPNLRISLFDTTFKSEAIISEKQVMFSDSVRIFNQYRVKLIGKINQLSNWENVAIEVQGIFTNKPGNIPELICYHIGTYIEVLYNRSQVETYNAKVVYDRAILRFMETNMTFIEHEINKNHSNYLLKQIEEEYRNMSNAVQAIAEKLENASTEVKKLQEDINNLCTITECVDICIPQQICEECQRTITVPIQGTCIYQCTKLENITIITGSEVATKWEYTPQENCVASPSCQVFTCVSNTVCETNYVSIPIEYIKYKTETRLVSTVDSCDKPCSETVVTAPVTALCCANLTCNSTEQDVECLNQNQQCAQVREMVYLNLDEADKNAAEILRSLEEAKRNESVIKLRLLRSRVNYDFAEKKFNESKRAYNDAASMLEIAAISFEEVKKRAQLTKLEKIKNSSVCGFAPPSYFEIRSARFDTTIITESPTQLAVDVVIFISQNVTATETLYIDFNNVNSSLKQGAITIIEKLVLSQNTVFKRHFRRQTNDFLPNNEFYFQKRCADISNILDYIKELNASIFTIADSAISSISGLKNNVLELSNLIKYSTNISNEELTIDSQQISNIINRNLTHFNTTDIKISGEIDELVKVMQEYLLNSQELENELGNSLYQSWQVKMEDLHNQTKSAAGFQCIGFSGCLQKVVDTLNDLISDIPLNINGIQSEFSNAAQSLMDLALLQNYDIVSAVSNTKNIYEIASNPSVTDYWCASIPKIIVHPVQYINATENATIELSCKAEVDQYTSYQWKKDGIQLFNQRNSTLVLTNLTLSDSGNYSCVITNQVGSANSFNSTVEVIQFPSFLLEPEDVNEYLGNVNGAIFQCNASGFPYPGYKWYFQPKGEKGFNKVPSSDQNVLVIAPPLPKDEGSYYCEAFIGNISIQSRVATLTVLDATVIQVAQTVYLNFSYLNRIGETEVQSSGSGSELTLEENIRHYINNDFSGSGEAEIGSGMNRVRNITITPYTKVALERSFLNALNTLMSFGSTTVQNITLSFVTPFDLAISFTLYSQNINYSMASFSRTNQLVPQAMIEWENTWQNLQELFSVSGFIITDNEYEYESLPSSLNVDILQFVCPAGKEVSSANNLICANCLPGSYQALDIRRVVDENDGRIIQYITPKCVRCPVGEYQNEQGQVLCKQCSPGYATLTNGAKQCLAQCSPGEYSQSGLEPCVMCPNETYSFANGSTTCYSCSDSNYQPLCPMHKIRYCPQGCYNNGTCVSPYTCICTAGWSGLDCNTGSAVKFSQLTYSIAEDSGPLQTVLILDNSLSINVTVQIIDSNNTALRGADYHSGPYNVTFMAGVTSVSLDISILDDDVIEDNENFTLTINIDSLPDGIITSSPSKVTVIIRNDDIAAECTIPKLDIVFVLDVSNSIKNEENFGVMKDFVKNTVDLMTINLKNSLAAVVLFGGKAWIQFSLTEHTNKNSFQNAIDSLKYKALKQAGTNTLDALNLLRIAGQDGRLGLRNDTIKIIVLITDGRPNLGHLNIPADQAAADTREAATKLHESGIYDQIYSVGIEGARPIGEFLEVVANPPSLVYHITGFNATLFQKLTQNFLSSFCDDGTKAPQ